MAAQRGAATKAAQLAVFQAVPQVGGLDGDGSQVAARWRVTELVGRGCTAGGIAAVPQVHASWDVEQHLATAWRR